MADDTVALRLIFANDTATREFTVPLATPVKDIKRTILEGHWPESMPPAETVDRLRLFSAGQELGGRDGEDLKSLREAKITVNASHPTPVHVQPILRAVTLPAPEAAAKSAHSQCHCTIL